MHVEHLTLRDFRSWPEVEVALGSGPTAFVGRNGQGKTNLVEAIDYLATLGSHRVATDAPLVRAGAANAIVRAAVVRDERQAVLEVEINPGRSNRARVNRSPLPRPRELLGWVRAVLFSPEDLVLVKGDPSARRRFVDDLLIQVQPRLAGVRADYDRVLKQRNSLLKSARSARFGGRSDADLDSTLVVWDAHLARLGGEIVAHRKRVLEELAPLLGRAYQAVARGARTEDAAIAYQCSFDDSSADAHDLTEALLAGLAERRRDELDRGVSLVGPHRDELVCSLGVLPVKGYASHGESWSFALAMRLASYDLIRGEGAPSPASTAAGGTEESGGAGVPLDDPILILDDVFAELDAGRRDQLAALVAEAEQVLITAAVADDVPEALRGARFRVADQTVERE